MNDFDQASRFAVKLDATGFFAWALGLLNDAFVFREWLDTRNVVLPGEAERTGDTIARLEHPSGTEPPWAVAVEFQIEPDPLMFGRLLVYLGHLWTKVKSDEERAAGSTSARWSSTSLVAGMRRATCVGRMRDS
jgi:hypothetical protein